MSRLVRAPTLRGRGRVAGPGLREGDVPRAGIALLAAAAASACAHAQPRSGGYLEVAGVENRISAEDFDGESYLTGGDVVVLLPELDAGRGFAVALGGQGGRAGGEVSYARVSHDARWLEARGSAVFHAVDFTFRVHALPRWPVDPFLSAGCGFKWLDVQDGATRGGEVGTARFTDFGWNLGGGVAVHLLPLGRDARGGGLALHVAAQRSWIRYTAVTPVKGDWASIDGDVEGGGWSFRVGLAAWFFPPPPR
jgi:hypothetical protein